MNKSFTCGESFNWLSLLKLFQEDTTRIAEQSTKKITEVRQELVKEQQRNQQFMGQLGPS
jgi:hypothetical protein